MRVTSVAEEIAKVATSEKQVDVQVSYEVVKLFSEQLYASPIKAIEELVVNSWDASASVCSVLVSLDSGAPIIAVYDNGVGMTLAQMEDLWHIGVSNKENLSSPRRQIGKFGIGKLASYAVARRATYISKSNDQIHAVTIDFEAFAAATDRHTGRSQPVKLDIMRLPDVTALSNSAAFKSARRVLQTRGKTQDLASAPSWTLVVLEDLKEKAQQLATNRLRWVLSTAMPFASGFTLYLNGERVESSKEKLEKLISFTVKDLEADRLRDLAKVTKEKWTRTAGGLTSPSFPQGITGDVYVTKESLYVSGGKSEDLGRSHGFFVRVHNRLINEADPLLGARPLSFSTWYRFAAIVEVPDLNRYITVSRDDVEQTQVKAKLRELLIQLFNQARDAYAAIEKQRDEENKRKKEGARDFVSTELVERPLADALVAEAAGGEAGTTGSSVWRLVEPIHDVDEMRSIVEDLYSSERKERHYTFKYSPAGADSPIAKLDPRTAAFTLNEDHELVREFAERDESRRLLESVVVAETLLEVYLHAADVEPEVVSDLLDRRDQLLRSLALDESFSLKALAETLRSASNDASDLEVAIVGALRALGFTAQHVGGSGTPDGLAEYLIHGVEEYRFTLEAKSSSDVPSLPQLDFAGLRSHYESNGAKGCLLVAPVYPGADDPNSEVSKRSQQQSVSCWTVEQLAAVVECAERRHINARRLQEIVFKAFTPIEVTAAVKKLLAEPTYDKAQLYRAVIRALEDLRPRLRATPRTVGHLAVEISRYPGFEGVDTPEVREAVIDLSRVSRGMLYVTEENDGVFVLGSLEELRRRVSGVTGDSPPPRRGGTFRERG